MSASPTGRSAVPLRGALAGLGAALLFGASAPFAKLLLPSAAPVALASLLYLGAFAGVTLWQLGRRGRGESEARLTRRDLPPLVGVVVCGGILGPVLMLHGLSRVSATAGSLLLNLEAPFTIALAVLLFGEHLGRRAALAVALVIAGAAVLAVGPRSSLRVDPLGAGLLALACLAWAVDNNLTQRLSLKDPLAVVRLKALGAGLGNLAIAALLGLRFPPPSLAGLALVLGAFAYGLSLVLDLHALRLLGAAREAAFFATAPFLGALLSVVLLGERPGAGVVAAALLMASGVALLLRERHSHVHTHESLEHDHLHVHDEHHQHAHDPDLPGVAAGEPHAHWHRHEPLAHEHPHVPDLHHRHRH